MTTIPKVFVVDDLVSSADVLCNKPEYSSLITLPGSHAVLLHNVSVVGMNDKVNWTPATSSAEPVLTFNNDTNIFIGSDPSIPPVYKVVGGIALVDMKATDPANAVWDQGSLAVCTTTSEITDDLHGLSVNKFIEKSAETYLGSAAAAGLLRNTKEMRVAYIAALEKCFADTNTAFDKTIAEGQVVFDRLADKMREIAPERFEYPYSGGAFVKGDEIVTSFCVKTPEFISITGESVSVDFKVTLTIRVV